MVLQNFVNYFIKFLMQLVCIFIAVDARLRTKNMEDMENVEYVVARGLKKKYQQIS